MTKLTRVKLWWNEETNVLKILQPDGCGWMCIPCEETEDYWLSFERHFPNPHVTWILVGEL